MNINGNHQVPGILRRVRNIIATATRLYECTNTFHKSDLQYCLRTLNRIRSYLSDDTFTNLVSVINGLLSLPQNTNQSAGYITPVVSSGHKGRPKFIISRDQLLYFYKEGFTIKNIAKNLNCSMSLVTKRLHEEGIQMKSKYSNITEEELKRKIQELHGLHPNSGTVMITGYLRSEGLIVQRYKIRQILNEIDPVGVASRWSSAIKRRSYKVPTPNSLWHMDAHCKLIRWNFIIHGCVDGYSRMIVYLSCATSIQAEPVLQLFTQAVQKYGIPSRMRSDHGYENIFVAYFMNIIRGINRGSHITGKSVHNQRIERLWVDVYKEVVDMIQEELYALENDNLLDIENPVHTLCVQFVYLPYINTKLKSFMDAWNFHKIRTASRKTPRQLWIEGMTQNCNSHFTAVQEIFSEQNSVVDRLSQQLELFGINTNIINTDISREQSLYTTSLNLNNEQILEMHNILNSQRNVKEKYLLCISYLNSE